MTKSKQMDYEKFGAHVLSVYLDKSKEVIDYLHNKYGDGLEKKVNDYVIRREKIFIGDEHFELCEDDSYFLFYLHGFDVFEAMETDDYKLLAELISSSFVLAAIRNSFSMDFNACYKDTMIHIFKVRARNGALKKHANDLKQKEKIFVKECWNNWQITPNQYASNTKFAIAMIDKFKPENPEDENKHINSVKVITDWCRIWKTQK